MRLTHISKVTDLRYGLIHPKRDWDGRFMSRRASAYRIAHRNITLGHLSLAQLRDVVSTMNRKAVR